MNDNQINEKDGKKIRIVASACCVLLLGISIYFTYNFFDLNIASNTICFIIILITILLVAETFLLSRKSKTAKIAIAMALIFSLLLGLAGYYLRVSSKALEKMTGVATSVDTIGLYVDESSKIELPEELRNARIGILETMGRDITDKGIQKLDKVITEDHKYVEYEDVATLTDALIEGDSEAIFINTAYYTLLSEIAEETHRNMKCIYEVEVVRALDLNQKGDMKEIDVTKDPFIVYISGNDNDGKLKANGTSDVNILMIVSPEDKKILLVNTPRDYYVTLAGANEKDKLTHAGMYGVDTSIKTLENLYEISIPYYIRLNFTGFMDIVDALGGITVISDVDFTVADWHFVKGKNELTGIESLAFARERYSFVEGDRQRGKNQQAVIKGIINKLSSPKVITNYSEIMKAVSKAIETNMAQDDIAALLNYQLSDRRSWEVESISVDGKGTYGECYTFPKEELSIIKPDEETIDAAKERIDKYLTR